LSREKSNALVGTGYAGVRGTSPLPQESRQLLEVDLGWPGYCCCMLKTYEHARMSIHLPGFPHADPSPQRDATACAMKGYLRRATAPAQVQLKRLRACVAAKQNGFWQIVR